MAIVVESVSTGQSPITKPSGLAVGDLMVALLADSDANSGTVPSGWTAHVNESFLWTQAVYTKIADSSDVAASTFTFQDTGGVHLTGVLYRITGTVDHATLAFQSSSWSDNDGNATVQFNPAFTPVAAKYIALVCFKVDKSSSTGSNSAYSMTGSPTFTERYDTTIGVRVTFSIADAYVNDSNLTQITNIQCTTTVTTSTNTRSSVIFIYEKVDATADPAHLSLSPPHFYQTVPQMIQAIPTIYSVTPIIETPVWTNEDKHDASNINNQDKS